MNDLHKAYAVLGLEPGSSLDAIMRRYKRLIMVWHPDRAPTAEHQEFAEEELKKINNAKDALTKHFAAGGGHRAAGCDCQPGQATASGGARSAGSAGPGPNYQRSKTSDEKYWEEQAAKKRDAERKAREEQEANSKRAQQAYQQKTAQQTMESAMQQQSARSDERLRWQISIGLILAFIGLEVFGSMAIGAKKWWHDFSWQWERDHAPKPEDKSPAYVPDVSSQRTPPYQTPPSNNTIGPPIPPPTDNSRVPVPSYTSLSTTTTNTDSEIPDFNWKPAMGSGTGYEKAMPHLPSTIKESALLDKWSKIKTLPLAPSTTGLQKKRDWLFPARPELSPYEPAQPKD